MSIYLTGDTHGEVSRLVAEPFLQNINIMEKVIIIILGDFGVIFDPICTEREGKALRELEEKPYLFLFVDGNHENHYRLNKLPETDLFGGKVGIVKENKIYHCKRGEIYTIENLTFFTFGGATSIDKGYRIKNISWWEEETATITEMNYGLDNLKKHNFKVDYILAHTSPENIASKLIKRRKMYPLYDPDPTRKYLEAVCERTDFKKFYCGHWHVNQKIGKYNFLFENIEKLT